ncbi:MAG: phytoene synthase, partial [Prochlorococcus sp. MED630]|nr:phytoene synthase [Prochlorococcus sp. MED630]
LRLYSGILNSIEKIDYDVFSNRAYVKGWVKAVNLPISYLITINDEKYKLRTLIN